MYDQSVSILLTNTEPLGKYFSEVHKMCAHCMKFEQLKVNGNLKVKLWNMNLMFEPFVHSKIFIFL